MCLDSRVALLWSVSAVVLFRHIALALPRPSPHSSLDRVFTSLLCHVRVCKHAGTAAIAARGLSLLLSRLDEACNEFDLGGVQSGLHWSCTLPDGSL
jgi:hypothetical protein